ncbi:hypothetical protein M4R23_09155 [Acidovorax sp. GBBC 3332]|nr:MULTISPECIES: hypothetical protein [unclassified Acidovorax]MDA8449851.1 hypothetical protein [Acidovorax sp. GBBC 3297]MDA8459296.1 hypothetical protein [Acidovorax sp. GBBC 3333]MDA8464333.1 hypothetical protein [Acidovorax sp. GBBC 3332]MDA8469456.1 hypothetical protein [Acidovorax sp. GBBC 3299]
MVTTPQYRESGNPIDETTSGLHLPLPHWLNDAHDDVLRLRDALSLIDAAHALLAGTKADKSALQALADRAALLEYGAARPSAVAYGYDVQGRVSNVTQTVSGVQRTTTLTYDAQGRVATAAYPVAGGAVRTDTYQYDAGTGRLTGVASTEAQP